jgi:L,D-peptidoglycan transpeptidase YkuD (ErfK/YbiS/YcfS/YnhG family)
MKKLKTIKVNKRPDGEIHHGLLTYNDTTINCCLGRSGITAQKKEGDGATPTGKFRLLYGFFRKDRLKKPKSSLQFIQIKANDGWCDSPDDPKYNSLVKLPFDQSHEIMTRDDRLYDVCIVLDYNIDPCVSGMGSAIFFHQTSPELKPTEGCVAIDPKDMQFLLPLLSDETEMIIQA